MQATHPWPPYKLSEWIAAVEADPGVPWMIDRLLPCDGVTLVSGQAKVTKKTLSVMQMVRCLASGRSMPGITLGPENTDVKAPVLFLEYEGPRLSLAQGWRWMDNGSEFEADLSQVDWAHRYSHVRLTDPEWAAKLVKLVQDHGIKLTVVDTFTRASGAPENDAQAMDAAFETLNKIRNASNRGGVIYIHHLRKQGDAWDDDFDLQVRGSSAFTGSYDHHLAFRTGVHSVHMFTRSKLDQDRFFRWHWDIRQEDEHISFELEEYDIETKPETELVTRVHHEIADGNVHTLKDFGVMWDLPRPVVEWLATHMADAGLLERTARGFRKV